MVVSNHNFTLSGTLVRQKITRWVYLRSHTVPIHPGLHSQTNFPSPCCAIQVPPFTQGFGEQLFSSKLKFELKKQTLNSDNNKNNSDNFNYSI